MTESNRAYLDGYYDMFHYGHTNGQRQAKEMSGYHIVVGIHSDEEIFINKCLPVTTMKERSVAVRACRWVDEVVENAPFCANIKMLKDYNCEVVMHAEDISFSAEQVDEYLEAKMTGKYREFKRTKGISTTELVGRTILRSNYRKNPKTEFHEYQENLVSKYRSHLGGLNGKVVYCDGVFDLFHAGHVELLKEAKKRGDTVAVGLFDDEDSNLVDGKYPIMNYNERLLGLLACKYVDCAFLASPNPEINFLKDLNVVRIVHGPTTVAERYEKANDFIKIEKISHDFSYLSEKLLVNRIFDNYNEYYKKIIKKLY